MESIQEMKEIYEPLIKKCYSDFDDAQSQWRKRENSLLNNIETLKKELSEIKRQLYSAQTENNYLNQQLSTKKAEIVKKNELSHIVVV